MTATCWSPCVEPDVATIRPRLLASLRRGIENDYIGQVSRDVVRLLQADANPGELVWEAVQHGAPRAEFGWGHSIASATDCLAMVDLYDGDQRAPADRAGDRRHRRDRARPPGEPVAGSRHASCRPTRSPNFARLSKPSNSKTPRRWFAPQSTAASDADDLQPWFTAVASDHLLSYGHGAIYCQKAFELLELIGWDRADTVLPYLVPTIVYGTREDMLPYTRPFMRSLGQRGPGSAHRSCRSTTAGTTTARLLATLLGDDRKAIVPAVAAALRAGAGVDGVLDVVVHDRRRADDALRHRRRARPPRRLRLARHHPWPHLRQRRSLASPAVAWRRHGATGNVHRLPGAMDRPARMAHERCRSRRRTIIRRLRCVEAGEALQREALLDNASAFIVYAHGIKTSRAAAREAARTGSTLPLQAVARLLDSPRLERFVAANVARSIEFLAGRAPHDE